MVRALLDGRKTQTRRLLKPQPQSIEDVHRLAGCGYGWHRRNRDDREMVVDGPVWAVRKLTGESYPTIKVTYAPGDRLYVRENFRLDVAYDDHKPTACASEVAVWYEAGGQIGDGVAGKLRPCIHLPRRASRLWLAVTDVRVHRLQEISEDDVRAEGVEVPEPRQMMMFGMNAQERAEYRLHSAHYAWSALWNSLHDKPGERWEDNPWICAVSFSVNRGNIDD
jgi:hypothetical protein